MSSNDSSSPQRRRFTRVGFKLAAMLRCGDRAWPCTIKDISLKGALVGVHGASVGLVPNDDCVLELDLGDDERITMKARLAHSEDELLGLHCVEIDLDSVTSLRRLVELNLTDPDTLERDLGALLDSVPRD